MSESKNVKLSDVYPIIKETLENGGEVTFNPHGTSMLPLLVQGRDSVTLVPVTKKLKKYDLPLYRRKSGQFVLHRIVGCEKDGTYTMCGDNQWEYEKGIEKSDIIGVVSLVKHNGKIIKCNSFKYKCYCRYIVFYRQLRKKASFIKHNVLKR